MAPAQARYWVGGTGTWDGTNTTNWASSSGGAGGASVPDSTKNAFFDANSGGGTVTLDYDGSGTYPECSSLICTGFTGSIDNASLPLFVNGDVTLSSGGDFTLLYVTIFANCTFTSVGNSVSQIDVEVGATLTLADDLVDVYNGLYVYGTFTTNNFNVTSNTVYVDGTLNMGSSTFTVSDWYVGAGVTINAGTSTISMTITATIFDGGGQAYYNLNIGNTVSLSGNNTFNTISNSTQPITINFDAGSTQTVTNFNVSGTAGNLVTLQSTTPGVQFTLSKASGTVSRNYLSIKDSAATGGAAWYAGANSTNVSNNTGWTFTAPPVPIRYWVGGTASWDGTAGSKWSQTSGGSGGAAVPTSSDTVFFDAASGSGTVTIASGAICSILNLTGFGGTMAFGSNSIETAGTGTVFTNASAFGVVVTGTPLIKLTDSSATARTISPGTLVSESRAISFDISAGSGSIAITSGSRIKSLIFSGTFTGSYNAGTASLRIFGDLTFKTGMTINGGSGLKTFAASSGTQNITGAGLNLNFPITLGLFSEFVIYKLLSDLDVNTASSGTRRTLTLAGGTLDLNGYTLSVNDFQTTQGQDDAYSNLLFNGGTLRLYNDFFVQDAGYLTTTAGTGMGYIVMYPTTFLSYSGFEGKGSTFNCTLHIYTEFGLGVQIGDSTNTFNDITCNANYAPVLRFAAGTTNTFLNFNYSGTAGYPVTLSSDTPGSAFTLSKSSGTVSVDYLSIRDSTATGGAAWYAGANSTNVSNNTGWIFPAPPVPIAVASRITSAGVLSIAGEFDEVTQATIRLTSTFLYSSEFDEYTLQGVGGGLAKRETAAGKIQVTGEFDEYNKP
jgi:hypothetical protein